MVAARRILVTAATGRIGREVVTALASAGFEVLAGSRRAAEASAQFASLPNVHAVELDEDREETLTRALSSVDAVCQVSPLSPNMGASTRNLLALAARAGVRQWLRFSLYGADDAEPILEGRWHHEADAAVRDSGMAWTVLQPTQYLQNFLGEEHCAAVATHGAISLPLDGAAVAYIDTRDLGRIAAAILAAEPGAHAGRTYALTGPQALTMDDVAAALGEAIGKPVRYRPMTPAQLQTALVQAGAPATVIEAVLGWFAYCRAGRAAEVRPEAATLLAGSLTTMSQFARDYADRFSVR